jgi:hypothetical protein
MQFDAFIPGRRLAPFDILTFCVILPLSQLHDHAFKPGDLYIKIIT